LKKEPDNIEPFAVINISSVGNVNDEIVLDGSDSYDLDGFIVEYRWSNTNGASFPNYIGDGEIITHVFEQPGIYNVELLVTDDDGAINVDYSTIEILTPYGPDADSDGDGIPDYLDNEDDSNSNDDDKKPPVIVQPPNSVPTKPVVKGPNKGFVDDVLEFIISADDEDEDSLRYVIQWGDGEGFISDFIPNGEKLIGNHSYNSSKEFEISVKSEDGKAVSGETIVNIKINEKEEPIDCKIIDNGGDDNVFWIITGILCLMLFIAPIGLIFRRK